MQNMNCWLKTSICKFFSKEEALAENIKGDLKEQGSVAAIEIFTELGSSFGALVIFILISFFDYKIWLYLFPVYVFQVFLVEIIKYTVKLPRPKNGLKKKNIFGIKTTSGSFPSGHTANVFALAVLFSNYFNLTTELILVFFVLASLIGISRIYLDKHYIIDVVGGAIFGVLFANLGLYLWLQVLSLISH